MLNPNEAPEGYTAVEFVLGDCSKCCFVNRARCRELYCGSGNREDETSVYFVKKEKIMQEQTNAVPHIHKDLIIAWANGAEIECYNPIRAVWYDIQMPAWNTNYKYCIKKTAVRTEIEFEVSEEYGLLKTLRASEHPNVKFYFEDGKLVNVEMLKE